MNAASRRCAPVVYLLVWFCFLASGRAERETCIAMNLIRVVLHSARTFVSFAEVLGRLWVVQVAALCRCHCFAAYYLSYGFYRVMDAFVTAIVFGVDDDNNNNIVRCYILSITFQIQSVHSLISQSQTANSEHAPSIPGMKTLSLIVLSKIVVGFVSSGAVYGEKSTCERARANPI